MNHKKLMLSKVYIDSLLDEIYGDVEIIHTNMYEKDVGYKSDNIELRDLIKVKAINLLKDYAIENTLEKNMWFPCCLACVSLAMKAHDNTYGLTTGGLTTFADIGCKARDVGRIELSIMRWLDWDMRILDDYQ